MTEHPRYCTTCGSELVDRASFCASCGTAAALPEPLDAIPPSAAPAAERVIAVIPNATVKRGFLGLGSKPHTIVLTDRRMIFALLTSQMMKQLVADARTEAKAEGKGFFKQWGAQLAAYSSFAAGYLEKSPDTSLAETPENFAIENRSIVKAKLKAGAAGDENTSASPDRLIIKTTDKKYSVNLGSGMRQAREALIAAELI